jgi:hypothetical protein
LVILQLNHAETSIYQVSLTISTPSPLTNTASMKRLNHLNNCLTASLQTLDTYFVFNPEHYFALPSLLMNAVARAVQILYFLSILDLPGWDRQLVRERGDVLLYLDRAMELLVRADESMKNRAYGDRGMDVNSSGGYYRFFAVSVDLLKKTTDFWRVGLDRIRQHDEELQRQSGQNGLQMSEDEAGMLDPMLPGMDWAVDIFSAWEVQPGWN